jgi:hypothetical protein
MPVCFNRGTELGRGDISIFLTDENGHPMNAAEISYSLSYVDPGPPETEVLIGPPFDRTPVNPAIGEYYAAVAVPPTANLGEYRVRWTFKQCIDSQEQTVVQRFGVVQEQTQTEDNFTDIERECIKKLRIMLRDNNPDRNYHFRPPEHEGDIKQYNQIFGYVWEDEELLTYMECALDWWNSMPPETETLCTLDLLIKYKPTWKSAIIWGAMAYAANALAFNWTQEQFNYSIGGVSLDINRTSDYMSLKQNAEGEFQKMAEAKARTTKIIRGLKQPRFGIGVRSSFGPLVGRGVLSPRSFVGL